MHPTVIKFYVDGNTKSEFVGDPTFYKAVPN